MTSGHQPACRLLAFSIYSSLSSFLWVWATSSSALGDNRFSVELLLNLSNLACPNLPASCQLRHQGKDDDDLLALDVSLPGTSDVLSHKGMPSDLISSFNTAWQTVIDRDRWMTRVHCPERCIQQSIKTDNSTTAHITLVWPVCCRYRGPVYML